MKQSNASNSDLVSSKIIRFHFGKLMLLPKIILSTSTISRDNKDFEYEFWNIISPKVLYECLLKNDIAFIAMFIG